jgi:salicylate hydroxylase
MLPIAVIGGGIAGLALAAALNRRGLTSLIFEAEPEPAEIGAGVQIAPNASRLLHRLGLAGRLRQVAVRPAATEFRRWSDDELIGRTALGDECERLYGAPYYTIHRADLRHALASLVCPDRILLGRRLVAVQTAAGRAAAARARLRFADGSSYEASMVVGADGIRSVVRATMVADKPVFSGLGVYRGLVPAAALPGFLREPVIRLWLGPGRHVVCYPVSAGRVISFAAIAPCDAPGAESWAAEGATEDLGRSFGGWNQSVQHLIAGTRTVRRWVLYDREPLPRLDAPRVALIGDAAHPMLPFAAQGANQAIEDALALAACLADVDADADAPDAARRYQEGRAPRTARLQQQARWSTHGLHMPDGDAQRSRDRALRLGTDLGGQAWLYGYDAERECVP